MEKMPTNSWRAFGEYLLFSSAQKIFFFFFSPKEKLQNANKSTVKRMICFGKTLMIWNKMSYGCVNICPHAEDIYNMSFYNNKNSSGRK